MLSAGPFRSKRAIDGKKRMENYSIMDEIGRGTHSFVYKARRKRSILYVAVKSTAKSRMDKILNEVQILHKLDSRHVLRFFNWYESQNHIWLIFEYCIGGDLLNLITQDKQLPEPAVRAFGYELAAGLQYLHSNSILYCDLKPSNILIDEFGSLKFADFGLARRIPTRENNSSSSKQLAPGSPNYMAPELFHQPAVHSFASDFWALGCVLYELCAGRQPFTHTNFSELARLIQTEPLHLPVEGCSMPTSFWDLLERLLTKDPYRRITWDELIDHPFWASLPRLAKMPMPSQELFLVHRESQPKVSATPLQDSQTTQSTSIMSTDNDHYSHQESDSLNEIETQSDEHAGSNRSSTTEEGIQVVDDDNSISLSDEDDSLTHDREKPRETQASRNQYPPSPRSTHATRPVTAPATVSMSESKHSSDLRSEPPHANVLQGRTNGGPRFDTVTHTTKKESSKPEKISPASLKMPPQTAPSLRQRTPAGDVSAEQDGKLGAKLRKAPKLIFTSADSVVKPIAFNQAIEALEAPKVRGGNLKIQTMTPSELLACRTDKLESHLKELYIMLKAPHSCVGEKVDVLAYLFTFCVHSKLANVIVNSSMHVLLTKLLVHYLPASRDANPPSEMLVVICMVLGVLYRHATFIAPSSPDLLPQLVNVLTQIAQTAKICDGNVSSTRMRLQAIASLGEVIFYASTQQEWEFPVSGLTCVISLLDDPHLVARHYAVRTLCNVLMHGTHDRLPLVITEQIMVSLVQALGQYARSDDSVENHKGLLSLRITTTQAIAQVFKHLRTPSTSARLMARTRTKVLLLFAKSAVLETVWHGVVEDRRSCDLAIASLNALNSFLEMKVDRERGSDGAIIQAGKTLFVDKIVVFSELNQILQQQSRYDDDSCGVIRKQSPNGDSEANKLSTGKRYTDDQAGLPSILRAKALLLLYFGIHLSHKFLVRCIRERYLDFVDRMLVPFASHLRLLKNDKASPTNSIASSKADTVSPSSSKSDCASRSTRLNSAELYLLQCAFNLIRLSIRVALKLSADCIAAGEDGITEHHQEHTQAISATSFELFNLLLKNPMCGSQLLHYFVLNEGKEYAFFLRLMSKLLLSFPDESLSMATAHPGGTVASCVAEIILRLFQIASNEAGALMLVETESLFSHLLPAVTEQLHNESSDEETAANCIRIVYLVLLHFQYDEFDGQEAHYRDTFVKEYLLPCFHFLFSTRQNLNENVWRFAVELLHALVSRDSSLWSDLEANELPALMIGLIQTPLLMRYHSLPSSATKLLRLVFDSKNENLQQLYDWNIAMSLQQGLAFATQNMLVTCLADMLEVLYKLLHHRYETLRKTGQAHTDTPDGFNELIKCGCFLVQLCAVEPTDKTRRQDPSKSPQPQESPTKLSPFDKELQEDAKVDIADLASRCLVFLSQIFGDKLNEDIFVSKQSKCQVAGAEDSVAGYLATCLEQRDGANVVTLRVLLILKNCLRCQYVDVVNVSHWLVKNGKLSRAIKNLSLGLQQRSSPSEQQQQRSAATVQDQIIKTASDIIRISHAK